MKRLNEWIACVAALIAGLWLLVRFRRQAQPQQVRAADQAADKTAREALSIAQEQHDQEAESIQQDAQRVRSGSVDDIASDFDSAFGTVQTVDPFEQRPDDDV